jgi:hypothetical protein
MPLRLRASQLRTRLRCSLLLLSLLLLLLLLMSQSAEPRAMLSWRWRNRLQAQLPDAAAVIEHLHALHRLVTFDDDAELDEAACPGLGAACSVVAGAMHMHVACANVQGAGCRVLASVQCQPAPSLLDAVLRALRQHHADAGVLHWGLVALDGMVDGHKDMQRRACDAGAVEMVLAAFTGASTKMAYFAILVLIKDDAVCQQRALAAGVLRSAAQLPPKPRAVLEAALLPAREAAAKQAADALLAELDAEADAATGPAEAPKRKKKKNKKAHRGGAGQQPAAAAAADAGARPDDAAAGAQDAGEGGAEFLVAGVPHDAPAPLPAPHATAAGPLPVAAAAPAVAAPPPPPPLPPLPPPAAADSSDEDADDSLPVAEQLRRLRLRNTALRDARNCAVCLAVPKSCMPLPCRHVCACEGCAAALAAQPGALCPLCREGIASWAKVFL